MRLLSVLFVMAMATLAPRGAVAQSAEDKATARNLFFEARDALDRGEFDRAADLFERSNAVYPAPTAALGLARSLAGGGKLVRAFETYTAIVNAGVPADASEHFKSALVEATAERTAVEKRLPALVIRVQGPAATEVEVAIDGRPVNAAALGVKRFVDPGRRVVTARAPGYFSQEKVVVVAESETQEVELVLKGGAPQATAPAARHAPASDDGMSGMRVAGLVVGGIGVGALVASAVTGGLYLSEKSTVDDTCALAEPGIVTCTDASGPAAAASGRTLALVNAVTLVGGVVLTGVGVTLFMVGGKDDGVTVSAGIGRASLRGAF